MRGKGDYLRDNNTSRDGVGERKDGSLSVAGERFTKEQRLRKRADFQACYTQGRRVQHQYFTLYLLERKEGKTRLGLTVSRKVGGAVLRNRIKRRVREIFRRSSVFPTEGYDVVFVAKKGCVELSYWELEQELTTTMRAALTTPPG